MRTFTQTQQQLRTTAPARFGLTLDVLRHPHRSDSTNHGISSRFDRLTLVGVTGNTARGSTGAHIVPVPHDCQVFEPTDDDAAALEIRQNGLCRVASIIPVTINKGIMRRVGSTMHGGNYATGDSRLWGLVKEFTGIHFYGAVAIHDRIEK
jgi:hypothetical protein